MNDEMLVKNLKKGDLDAFRMIYSKYKPKVLFFAWSYLKSKEKAEDIVQDVFTKVWENCNFLQEHYSFNNYLFTITKNTILNNIRKANYEIRYRENITEMPAIFDFQENDTLDSVICKDLNTYINKEVEKLPPAMKRIYKLSRVQL
ncbi:sigma-70 family RNA polymerase sigma factor, partial [Bacteroidota bacterium]